MNSVVPIVFGTFKLLVLAIGMFFAIKSHYDEGKKVKEKKRLQAEQALLQAEQEQLTAESGHHNRVQS